MNLATPTKFLEKFSKTSLLLVNSSFNNFDWLLIDSFNDLKFSVTLCISLSVELFLDQTLNYLKF